MNTWKGHAFKPYSCDLAVCDYCGYLVRAGKPQDNVPYCDGKGKAMEKQTSALELRVVKNGYWIRPGRNMTDVVSMDEVYVFETFDSLTRWLKANLPPIAPPTKAK